MADLKATYSVDRINGQLLNEIMKPGNTFYELGRALRTPTVGASGAVYAPEAPTVGCSECSKFIKGITWFHDFVKQLSVNTVDRIGSLKVPDHLGPSCRYSTGESKNAAPKPVAR